jgi:hypothetical protein
MSAEDREPPAERGMDDQTLSEQDQLAPDRDQVAADSIGHELRSDDVICRFGVDEFLCSLAGQDADGAPARFHATSGATISLGSPNGRRAIPSKR